MLEETYKAGIIPLDHQANFCSNWIELIDEMTHNFVQYNPNIAKQAGKYPRCFACGMLRRAASKLLHRDLQDQPSRLSSA